MRHAARSCGRRPLVSASRGSPAEHSPGASKHALLGSRKSVSRIAYSAATVLRKLLAGRSRMGEARHCLGFVFRGAWVPPAAPSVSASTISADTYPNVKDDHTERLDAVVGVRWAVNQCERLTGSVKLSAPHKYGKALTGSWIAPQCGHRSRIPKRGNRSNHSVLQYVRSRPKTNLSKASRSNSHIFLCIPQ